MPSPTQNDINSTNLEEQTPPIQDEDIDKDFSELVRILYKNERYYDEDKQSKFIEDKKNLDNSPNSTHNDFLNLQEKVLKFNIKESKTDAERKLEEKILSEKKPIIEKLLIYCEEKLRLNQLPDNQTSLQRTVNRFTGLETSYEKKKNIHDRYEDKKKYFRAILTSINKQLPYYNPNIPYNNDNIPYFGIETSYGIGRSGRGLGRSIIGGKKSRRSIKNKKSKKRKTKRNNHNIKNKKTLKRKQK